MGEAGGCGSRLGLGCRDGLGRRTFRCFCVVSRVGWIGWLAYISSEYRPLYDWKALREFLGLF